MSINKIPAVYNDKPESWNDTGISSFEMYWRMNKRERLKVDKAVKTLMTLAFSFEAAMNAVIVAMMNRKTR